MTWPTRLITALTALLPLSSSVPLEPRQSDQTVGYATVTNRCPFPVYYNNVPQQGYGNVNIGVIPPYCVYQAQYDQPQIGHSIKLSLSQGDLSDILQFEYSQTMNGNVDYDVSQVNGNPFGPWGFSLDAVPGCPAVRCESPVDGCTGIYSAPTGNMDPNFYCPLSFNTGVTLCSG